MTPCRHIATRCPTYNMRRLFVFGKENVQFAHPKIRHNLRNRHNRPDRHPSLPPKAPAPGNFLPTREFFETHRAESKVAALLRQLRLPALRLTTHSSPCAVTCDRRQSNATALARRHIKCLFCDVSRSSSGSQPDARQLRYAPNAQSPLARDKACRNSGFDSPF